MWCVAGAKCVAVWRTRHQNPYSWTPPPWNRDHSSTLLNVRIVGVRYTLTWDFGCSFCSCAMNSLAYTTILFCPKKLERGYSWLSLGRVMGIVNPSFWPRGGPHFSPYAWSPASQTRSQRTRAPRSKARYTSIYNNIWMTGWKLHSQDSLRCYTSQKLSFAICFMFRSIHYTSRSGGVMQVATTGQTRGDCD